MSKKVFISYCHRQGEWIGDRLVPCLRYGGADALVDRERFKAGFSVIKQMDDAQDAAEMSVLVFTPDYLRSDYCIREMKRAIANRNLDKGLVIPVKREDCQLPDDIESAEPLWVNLCDDKNAEQWNLLLDACGADLGAEAPHWLEVRDEIMLRRESMLPGEWEYLLVFRKIVTQPPPDDENIAASIRRRLLIEEDNGQWRLRAPLMARWLRLKS